MDGIPSIGLEAGSERAAQLYNEVTLTIARQLQEEAILMLGKELEDEQETANDGPNNQTPKTPAGDYGKDYNGGITDAITLEVFSLRRRNAELRAKNEALNIKLTKTLEMLHSERRFLQLWIYENQGESYDEIQHRMKRIDATIQLIEDRMAGPAAPLEIPAKWKRGE